MSNIINAGPANPYYNSTMHDDGDKTLALRNSIICQLF